MLRILVAFISVTASSAGKYDSYKGVKIKSDNAFLSMGKKLDVNIVRSGASKLSIDATVGIQKKLEVTGTANFKAGIQNSGFVFSGSLDDGGNNGQWWPLLKMSKAKDGGYNPHWFAMTVMSNHNAAIDVFKLSGHWSDRSDHKSKHGDFHGFTAQRQGTACTYAHACDIAFRMSNCGRKNGDMFILVAKALKTQNTGKAVYVLDAFHKGKDTWKWGPYTSKTLPAGCKKLAKPSKPTPGTASGGRRLEEVDSRVEALQQQLSDANEKIMAQARELQRQKDDLAAIKAALKL